ncbi:hypothetical protein B0H19DRAFT_1039170 [Mycena capillaripes]|nr:hypothetical protein B0H19DRAFT_1039170 [Mycena capillaripes]
MTLYKDGAGHLHEIRIFEHKMSYYRYPFESNFGDEDNQQPMSANYTNSTSAQWGASSQYPSTQTDPTRNMSSYPPSGAGYPQTAYNPTASQSQYMNLQQGTPTYNSGYADSRTNPTYSASTYASNTQYAQSQQFQSSLATPAYPTTWNVPPPSSYGSLPPSSNYRGPRSSTPYPPNPQPYPPSPHAQIVLPEAPEDQRPSIGRKECSHCRTRSTPTWRRDPSTHQPLCNACGVYQSTRQQRRPQTLIDVDNEDPGGRGSGSESNGPVCSNCGTSRTSTWRRNKAGEQVCNACGVYERTNSRPRPPELRSDKIRPRQQH